MEHTNMLVFRLEKLKEVKRELLAGKFPDLIGNMAIEEELNNRIAGVELELDLLINED